METPIITKKQSAFKKAICAIFFKSTTLVNAINLDGQTIGTAKWFTKKYLPKLPSRVLEKEIIRHHGNASYHRAAIILQFFFRRRYKSHPPYSLDLAT